MTTEPFSHIEPQEYGKVVLKSLIKSIGNVQENKNRFYADELIKSIFYFTNDGDAHSAAERISDLWRAFETENKLKKAANYASTKQIMEVMEKGIQKDEGIYTEIIYGSRLGNLDEYTTQQMASSPATLGNVAIEHFLTQSIYFIIEAENKFSPSEKNLLASYAKNTEGFLQNPNRVEEYKDFFRYHPMKKIIPSEMKNSLSSLLILEDKVWQAAAHYAKNHLDAKIKEIISIANNEYRKV